MDLLDLRWLVVAQAVFSSFITLGPARYLFSRFLPLHLGDVLSLPQLHRCGEVVVQSLVDLVWHSISVTFLRPFTVTLIQPNLHLISLHIFFLFFRLIYLS